MKLLMIRHGMAEDRERFAQSGEPDALRPLTPEGRRKLRKMARGLRRVARSLELLATSPLARAVQSAEIIRAAYEGVRTVAIPQLAPGRSPDGLLRWLRGQHVDGTIALVGHEPDLGALVGWLTTGATRPLVAMKQGQACLLDFAEAIRPGGAVIAWSLRPAHLRRLG